MMTVELSLREMVMDIETRRLKQQKFIVQMVERKVRARAEQLFNQRGREEGQALEDWLKAEAEIIDNSIIAPLYRRLRGAAAKEVSSDFLDSCAYESQA
jgi:hypothetical protein